MRKVTARFILSSVTAFAAASALAQSPTPAMPTPPPLSSYPAPMLYGMPTPAPLASPTPLSLVAPAPTPAPTPLPDGTMPLPLPAMPNPNAIMPTPAPDASTLSDQLSLPPTPTQSHEKLDNAGGEKGTLKDSEQLAMQQKMVMSDFEKSLDLLIAKQRNPNVPSMTLNDAVQIALRQNPTVLNAIQQIRLTRGQLIEVVSQAIPQIAITSSYSQQAQSLNNNGKSSGNGKGTIEIPSSNGGSPTVINFSSGNSNNEQNQSWNINFQATQLIFDGGATISGIKAGNATYDAAFYSLRATIDSIISQIISQFYQVVLDRALIVAQEQNSNLLQQQVQDQQNRYDAGTVPRFNVLQAEVALANAQPPLIQAKNNYRIAMYQLVQLLGMDYPAGRPSEVPFNVVGNLGYSPQKIDTDASIRTSIVRNPSLKAQRESIIANAANVNVQLAGYLPTIKANGGYEIVNNPSSADIGTYSDGWFFGATGNWNIFDGGATYGAVAQAKAQLMQAKNTYDNGVRGVVLNVQESISNLQEAQETIDSQTASVVQATEALRLSRERLDAGAGTQLDVLNAQVQLLQAQTNVLQARYDYIAAMASYDLALSLDTQYVETFDDPLVHPLSPQALNAAERRHFTHATSSQKPQPSMPWIFRHHDPIKPILQKPSPTPSPTPKKKKSIFSGK